MSGKSPKDARDPSIPPRVSRQYIKILRPVVSPLGHPRAAAGKLETGPLRRGPDYVFVPVGKEANIKRRAGSEPPLVVDRLDGGAPRWRDRGNDGQLAAVARVLERPALAFGNEIALEVVLDLQSWAE